MPFFLRILSITDNSTTPVERRRKNNVARMSETKLKEQSYIKLPYLNEFNLK